MTHVAHVIDALHLEHVGLVRSEVGIGLDVLRHILEFSTLFEFHIHHTTMDTLAKRNRHRESVLHTFLRTHAYAMTHRHTRTEVGITQSLGCETLHEGTDDRITTRIPTCSNHADGVCLLIEFHQTLTIAAYVRVDVERVDGVDTQRQDHVSILLARACWGGEDGHIDILQFADVLHHVILCQFCGLVLCAIATYDACHFHVGGCLQCLECILSDVAVTYDGGSDFLHIYKL